MKIALCLLVALCVLSITMARGNDRGKHGKGRSIFKRMYWPNPDHKPTGAQSPTGTPTGAQSPTGTPTSTLSPEIKQKMYDDTQRRHPKGRNTRGY